jgi:hypothetical protein
MSFNVAKVLVDAGVEVMEGMWNATRPASSPRRLLHAIQRRASDFDPVERSASDECRHLLAKWPESYTEKW